MKPESTIPTGTLRLMLDRIMAWQTWRSFGERQIRLQETLHWQSGEEVHYELGETGVGLHYAYIASNTDIRIFTNLFPQDELGVNKDINEYAKKLKSSRAHPI